MRSAWNRRWGGYLMTALLVAFIAASCGPDSTVRSEAESATVTVGAVAFTSVAPDDAPSR
jgi:hypothetical protein